MSVAATGVLVIDQTFRPVDHIGLQEAATKLALREAFPLPGATIIATFRSPSMVVEVPSIITLKVYVPVPKKLSRHITNTLLFARDNWTCQYCGTHKRDLPRGVKLTRDHVKPVHMFPGTSRSEKLKQANTWDNVATACSKCNNVKADRTPMESGMYPLTTPKRPTGVLITIVDKLDGEQLEFVRPFLRQ